MPHGPVVGKRKPDGVCLRRAFRSDVVSYAPNRFVWVLLQQRHPLRIRVPAAADDAVQVDSAGHVTINTTVSLPQFRLDSGIDFAVGHFNSSGTLYSA